MANGKLVVNAKNQIRVRFTNAKNVVVEMAVPEAELSSSLRAVPPKDLNGRDVELDVEKGQPRKVRPVGEAFAAPQPQPPAGGQRREQQSGRRTQQGERRPEAQGQRQRANQRPAPRPAFHNPYNFVPAPPRAVNDRELGDHEPTGHHCYQADRVSGVIRVMMTLKTPLLLPDAGCVIEGANDHKTFPVRLDADGKPLVAPTGIKGMLRSAYEAVTSSRMAVFAGHEDRLADRMPARDGLALVPARVVNVGGADRIELLPGTSGISGSGRPVETDPMYAAWLPRYHQHTGQVASFAVRYPDNSLPQHREEVEVWLELWERTGQHPFDYWLVRRCVRAGQSLGSAPAPGASRGRHQPVAGVNMRQLRGFVCVTNRNIDRKHDERVFFTTRSAPVQHPLTDDLRDQWRELITNYQAIHEVEIASGMTSPPALNNSVWSRQVDGGVGERALPPGTLCYAAFHEGVVTALYPVMISRRLHEASPSALLPDSLRPATAFKEFSPADRVFGWVSQSGQGAYRGNVRVGPVVCESSPADAVERFPGDGLPLAILGPPKEQQARFYVAASPQSEAQADGISKEDAGYQQDKGLRGRKVYPHHAGLPDGYWRDPMTDRTQQADNGHYQEYRRPRLDGQEQRDNQNRSIQGWVKERTSFSFDLHVTNLSRVELGALLWLLKLPPDHFHRLGGGKPLGFGSVRLEIDAAKTILHDGNGWKQLYGTLDTSAPPVIDQKAAIKEFESAVVAAYGAGAAFEHVPFIAAFLRMASGFADRLPTHYPRAQHPPHPEGRAYEWFVDNDRTGAQGGPRVCLRDLATDSGLPMLPEQD